MEKGERVLQALYKGQARKQSIYSMWTIIIPCIHRQLNQQNKIIVCRAISFTNIISIISSAIHFIGC